MPLIDPAVVGSTLENANAKTSLTTPFSADGLSVAQIMIQQGFSNFTTTALDGTKGSATTVSDSNASSDSTSVVSSAASPRK